MHSQLRKADLRGTDPAGLEESEQVGDLSSSGNHHLHLSNDGTASQIGIYRSNDLANESIQ